MRLAFLLVLMAFADALAASAAITVTNIAPGCEANHSLLLRSDGSLWGMGTGVSGGNPVAASLRPQEFAASCVTGVAVGGFDSVFVKSDGSLWGMGENFYGDLGIGTWSDPTNQPVEIVTNGVTAVAMGYGHSLFIKSDGSLWGMGQNSEGQLGDALFTPDSASAGAIYLPVEIVTNGVTAVAAGAGDTLFIKTDGSLWAMGGNLYSDLGDGTYYTDNPSTNQPEEIVASGVVAIAAGGFHNLFLKSDGSLWGMGDNHSGQLGSATFFGTNRPVEIVAGNVTAIAAGEYHSLFVKSDGSLWAMGDNTYGELGDGTYNQAAYEPEEIVSSDVTAVAAGGSHSLFLKSDGSLWGMGDNSDDQLGDGFGGYLTDGTIVPEQILPEPSPVLTQTVSNSDLQFTATCGIGGNFYLLTATNIAQPFSQWIPIYTNAILYRNLNVFSATLTNAVNPYGKRFYILQSP